MTAVCLLGFGAGLAIVIATIDLYRFAFGQPPILLFLLTLPLAATMSTAILSVCLAHLWWKNIPGRVHLTLATTAAWATLWSLHYWNLLGYYV
jgi:hypothetical protein